MPNFMASRSRPLIYLNVPKAACTSIKNWLYTLDTGEVLDDPHAVHDISQAVFPSWDGSREQLEERFHNSFVFTFVRHPLRRAYSAFNEKIYGTGPRSFGWFRRYIEKNFDVDFAASRTPERHRRDFLGFLKFVDFSGSPQSKVRNDWHWACQTIIVQNGLSARPLDFIGRVEAVEADFAVVAGKGNCPGATLPRLNEGPPAPFGYDEIVDEEIRELGARIYADDLRNFAYSI